MQTNKQSTRQRRRRILFSLHFSYLFSPYSCLQELPYILHILEQKQKAERKQRNNTFFPFSFPSPLFSSCLRHFVFIIESCSLAAAFSPFFLSSSFSFSFFLSPSYSFPPPLSSSLHPPQSPSLLLAQRKWIGFDFSCMNFKTWIERKINYRAGFFPLLSLFLSRLLLLLLLLAPLKSYRGKAGWRVREWTDVCLGTRTAAAATQLSQAACSSMCVYVCVCVEPKMRTLVTVKATKAFFFFPPSPHPLTYSAKAWRKSFCRHSSV